MNLLFVVNGRYVTQNITRVQRYARNIVNAIDQFDDAIGSTVLLPKSVGDAGFRRLRINETGVLNGYAGELIELPFATKGQRLLNLCNVVPTRKSERVVCIHDANVLSAPESYRRGFPTVYDSLHPSLVRRATEVATSSRAARKLARYLPISFCQIAVLRNGYEHALYWNPTNPSLTEEFGRPVVKVTARGCPVISSDCIGMPEICGDAALMAVPFAPPAIGQSRPGDGAIRGDACRTDQEQFAFDE
ncbi:hypothetical protein ACQQ2Q_15590 [Agrobacterium sp. ES01]|uniref:hypothetical protein n=1 Tax=Agrobacterium sp. ES01 TaxID=3420714 RepID=UPI003D0A8587